MKVVFEYKCTLTPIGELCFVVRENNIFSLHRREKVRVSEGRYGGPYADLFEEELHEYFQGKRKLFSFEPVITGSPLRRKVLEETLKIPYGSTTTYKSIATKLSTSPRAIGRILKTNNILLVVPCHRIIKATGEPGGYTLGFQAKLYLLQLENPQRTLSTLTKASFQLK
ncbi:MAG: methylated-DNA--[protein]-cysteine S-methyltransferase [Infirmifilum sp.]